MPYASGQSTTGAFGEATSQRPVVSPAAMPPRQTAGRAAAQQPPAGQASEVRSYVGQQEAARRSTLALSAFGQRVTPQVVAGPSTDEQPATAEPAASQAAMGQAAASVDAPTTAPAKGSATVDNLLTPSATTTKEAPAGDDRVLFTRQSPTLDVKTIGPRRITVGKESTYEVFIYNSGPVAADGVTVSIELPDWADVQEAQASAGTATTSAAAGEPLRWAVGRLEARGQERLVLRIIPRQSRPFDLGVTWNYTPIATQAVIEVQEPKLQMQLEGPREILYGERELYRLKLVNSGNGDAENVAISLSPMGGGNNLPVSHKLGTIAAGETKVVEVELTARQTGNLTVDVDARGDGTAAAHLSEQILVLRPGLKVDLEAPEVRYVKTEATYEIRVSNPGTAEAKNLKLTATIPPAATYVSCLGNGQLAPDQRSVTWTMGSLAPGGEATVAVTCRLEQAGACRLEVQSVAEGDLTASAEATTQVETIADLVLDVDDPAGPVAVDVETTYHVAVQNRGSRPAEDVEVLAYFSRGIEPTSAEGAPHEIGSGQVVFEQIRSVAAGESIALKIHARASSAGNHIFRVEVYCKGSGIRLVSEEMTHFYSRPVSQRAAGDTEDADEEVARTARRR